MAQPLAGFFQHLGIEENLSSLAATAFVVAGITYFSIVLGELVPKRLAQSNAEGIARVVARPIAWLAHLSRPFVLLLSISTDALLKILGRGELSSARLTEEDIHAMLVEGSQSGVIEKQEHEIVRNVFRLDDRPIASLMTPRSEIICLDIQRPLEESLADLMASDHSGFPVCRGGLHDVLGVVTSKTLFRHHLTRGTVGALLESLQSAVYVPESLTGMQILEQFKKSGFQMVFVVDEYGEILGLVTLHDLLEALAGEFAPPDSDDHWAVLREDGSWLLDGLIPILDLKDRLGLEKVPEEEKGRYNTLSGMLMWLGGKVPRTGDVIDWQGWRFEVVDLDGKRIDKVLAHPVPAADSGHEVMVRSPENPQASGDP